jgi:uncharacterized protein YbjT (DUF2867 family)/aryl carrier-like protein
MDMALSRDQLRSDVATVLGVAESALVEDLPLVDQGLDSIRLMSLVECWRTRGVPASFLALATHPTLAGWAQLLCGVASSIMSHIVVIGGHGKVALHLARILNERGDEVTSVFRTPDHADDVSATGARPVVADIETLDTDTLASLLAGHDAVVFSAGAGGGNPARTYAVDRDAAIRVIDAAQQTGLRRFVMVSYFGAGPDHGVPQDNPFFPYAEAKAAADAHLRASNLDWTVLGPGRLTLEPATGRIEVCADSTGGAGKGAVSREDVALVAAAALNDDSTIGRTINFNNGNRPITEALAAT